MDPQAAAQEDDNDLYDDPTRVPNKELAIM
jgi:hypothetical protein